MDSQGNLREDDKEQRSSEEVRRLRNLVENLRRQAERECVTRSIFELKNTSGVNYVFILGRSSAASAAVTICRYGSNDRRL
jgi:hypothetical protein